jgi:hypothetical protein
LRNGEGFYEYTLNLQQDRPLASKNTFHMYRKPTN